MAEELHHVRRQVEEQELQAQALSSCQEDIARQLAGAQAALERQAEALQRAARAESLAEREAERRREAAEAERAGVNARLEAVEGQFQAVVVSLNSSHLKSVASPSADGCARIAEISELKSALSATRSSLESLSQDFLEERRERYRTLVDVGHLATDVAEATSAVVQHAEEKLAAEVAGICSELQKVASAKHVSWVESQRLQELFQCVSKDIGKRVDRLEHVLQELMRSSGLSAPPMEQARGVIDRVKAVLTADEAESKSSGLRTTSPASARALEEAIATVPSDSNTWCQQECAPAEAAFSSIRQEISTLQAAQSKAALELEGLQQWASRQSLDLSGKLQQLSSSIECTRSSFSARLEQEISKVREELCAKTSRGSLGNDDMAAAVDAARGAFAEELERSFARLRHELGAERANESKHQKAVMESLANDLARRVEELDARLRSPLPATRAGSSGRALAAPRGTHGLASGVASTPARHSECSVSGPVSPRPASRSHSGGASASLTASPGAAEHAQRVRSLTPPRRAATLTAPMAPTTQAGGAVFRNLEDLITTVHRTLDQQNQQTASGSRVARLAAGSQNRGTQ